jgi:subtilisin family serine protease
VDGSDESGHGTIVASIAAGQPSNISSYFGVAPDSKIAFFDIGDSNGDLCIPSDLNNELLKPLHNTGATVSSHSWGSTSNSYTVLWISSCGIILTHWFLCQVKLKCLLYFDFV